MSTQAAEQHKKAAEQYGHAARHYQEAAAHYKRGQYAKAAHEVQTARGHHAQATEHASTAAEYHAESYVKNLHVLSLQRHFLQPSVSRRLRCARYAW
jgi:hypothetical protein